MNGWGLLALAIFAAFTACAIALYGGRGETTRVQEFLYFWLGLGIVMGIVWGFQRLLGE
jgi:hypothetical protein